MVFLCRKYILALKSIILKLKIKITKKNLSYELMQRTDVVKLFSCFHSSFMKNFKKIFIILISSFSSLRHNRLYTKKLRLFINFDLLNLTQCLDNGKSKKNIMYKIKLNQFQYEKKQKNASLKNDTFALYFKLVLPEDSVSKQLQFNKIQLSKTVFH